MPSPASATTDLSSSVIPLVLRRMRAPLILLITAYTIAITGFVLIPGQTPEGEPWRMDFMHAFYFVSYMATTIGFGEIPYEFTRMQRMWTLFTIYLTVIAWFYALGTIIALIQEPGFRRAVVWNGFRRAVRRIREPFYLVCGYGDTGQMLVRAVTERGRRCVVIDRRLEAVHALSLANLPTYVPGICGDAQLSDNLIAAGLTHPDCAGVLAVTDDDHANLQVAVTVKLLSPNLRVICRAETQSAEANMESFGTDYVVNPFTVFADELCLAVRSPRLQTVHEALSGIPGQPLREVPHPPRGRWIICGYGRMGEALHRYLSYQGIPAAVVDTQRDGRPEPFVLGRGTEAVTLREARIAEASAVVAATDDDPDNLSILLTARDLKPDLFLVARQEHRANEAIFAAARPDVVAETSRITAMKMLSLLAAPLLPHFLRWIRHQDDEVIDHLAARLEKVASGRVPQLWTVRVSDAHTPALADALRHHRRLNLDMLLRSPGNRARRLNCVPLLLEREGKQIPLPGPELEPQLGDRLLLCGDDFAHGRILWTLCNYNALRYVQTGEQRPSGLLWRYLARRRLAAGRR